MRRKTNRLLLLLISGALAACSSQSERGSSGLEVESAAPPAQTTQVPAEPAYEPERSGVSYIEAPLAETPVVAAPVEPEPAPVEPEPAPAEPEPAPVEVEEFPITTYEMPPEPQEAAVDDLGPIGVDGDRLNYAEEQTPDVGTGVGAPEVFLDEEETAIEDLGPIATSDETLSFAPDATPDVGTGISEPNFPVNEEPAPPAAITVTFDAEPLFNFDKYNVRPDQRGKIDHFVASLKGTEYETVWAIGHADRIGKVDYNQKLSEKRADSVKAYLVRLGIPADKIRTLGRSNYNPLTREEDCKGMRRKELIVCYQPDRRVEVSVSGQKSASAE